MNKKLSGKRFLLSAFGYTILTMIVLAGINVLVDIYGLFLPSKGREIPVYHNERITKYLLSYNYIPTNFNTVVIGTSLSDNLDFSKYNGGLRIYNASVMGANIHELKPILTKTVNGGIKNVIICISPYQFKNSGAKEVEFNDKLVLGALGSLDIYQTYMIALIRRFNLLPGRYPKGQFNASGANDYDKLFALADVQKKIDEEAELHRNERIVIHPGAMNEFKSLLSFLDGNEVNYLVYFHPLPQKIFESNKTNILDFQSKIENLVGNSGTVLNFNNKQYSKIYSNVNNYIDHGHLSKSGQKLVSTALYDNFHKQYVSLDPSIVIDRTEKGNDHD